MNGITPSLLTTLCAYNAWATTRLLNSAAKLSEEEYTTPGRCNQSSIKEMLFHMLRYEWVWRSLAQFGALTATLPASEDYPTLPVLRSAWAAEAETLRQFVTCLDEAALAEKVLVSDRHGQERSFVRWQMLLHLALHSMQHRSEVAMALTTFGHSPGDLDFIYFVQPAQNS